MTDDLKGNQNRIAALLQGLQQDDPRLFELLRLMNRDLGTVFTTLYPIKEIVDIQRAALTTPPLGLGSFAYSLNLYDITLFWTPDTSIVSTSPGLVPAMYELRQGTSWDSATFILKTPSLSALIPPLPIGTTHFLMRTINSAGVYSNVVNGLDVVVPAIVPSTVTSQTIDNNVLLYWTPFTSSFAIDHYNIYRNASLIGHLSGTFFTIFETIAGTYTYYVEAVDVAGNISAKSPVNATVTQPPDFQLLTQVTPDLSAATLTNIIWDPLQQKLIVSTDTSKTWQSHFVDYGFASPQDQVNAGFDIYIQPDALTSELITAEIDLGSELSNVIVNLTWSLDTFPATDAISIAPYIKGAPASHVYGSYIAGASVFFSAVRWITIKIDFSGTTDALVLFYNLKASVDVKREVDSNTIPCVASDTDGTQVNIPGVAANGHGRKTFKDVDSITLTPAEANKQPVECLLNFVDIPNPTFFKVLCFDSSGRRVDATVSWKVRGIV